VAEPRVASIEIREAARAAGVDLDRLPTHVAVIMDGNGRWAQRRGLARLLGHREGYRTLRTVLLAASELGLRYLTVYAFSAENWRRPQDEVAGLMKLIEQAAREELRVMHRNNVRVRVAGRIEELPASLREALIHGTQITANNTGITFTLAVNYGGRAEIVDGIKKLMRSGVAPESIDEAAVSAALYNPDIPDPDLLVRTAGERRWSNFLTWQSAYAELVVLDEPWPEFGESQLVRAILEYQGRTRKFGGLSE
jgi:undecaprenyl diphosphate synthase